MVGGHLTGSRTTRSPRSTWRPRATASPARRSSSSRSRSALQRGHHARLGDRLPAAEHHRAQRGGKEHFIVHNFGNAYSGPITLADATAVSDNSVFAQVGHQRRHARGSRSAPAQWGSARRSRQRRDDPRRPQDRRLPARHGARLRDDRRAAGSKVYEPQARCVDGGPIGIARSLPGRSLRRARQLIAKPRLRARDPGQRSPPRSTICCRRRQPGTGTSAADPRRRRRRQDRARRRDYGDAWFVGWTPKMTVAVWVGYPNSACR